MEILTVRESPTAATTLISPGLSSWTTQEIEYSWWQYISEIYKQKIKEQPKKFFFFLPDVGGVGDGLRSVHGMSVPITWQQTVA